MNYVNNWQRPITLAAAATTAALDLPDGTYRLCISNADRSLFEVVDAAVVSGVATLSRGIEGTAAQEWAEGSLIYCSVTAGQLAGFAGKSVLTGNGIPSPLLIAAIGTFYLNLTDFTTWIAVEVYPGSEGDEVYWIQFQYESGLPEISAGGTFATLGFDFEQEFVMLVGDTIRFNASIATIYTSATLASDGSDRTYTAVDSPVHIKLCRYLSGDALFIATPLTVSAPA